MRRVELALPGQDTTIAIAPAPRGKETCANETGYYPRDHRVDADHAAVELPALTSTKWSRALAVRYRRCSACATPRNSLIIVHPLT